MSSDKKRIERDIFGDDDDDEDDLPRDGDRDYEDRSNTADEDRSPRHEGGKGDDKEGQDDDDEGERGVPLPSFKKRHVDGGSPPPQQKKKKIAKKSRPSQDDSQNAEGEDLPLDPRQQALLQLEKDFELALKSGKSTTRRRKKDDDEDLDGMDEVAARFVEKMHQAAHGDIDSKLKGEPALAKVRMLESVKRQLNKSQLHDTFLDGGILEAMRIWLEPLQDSSLPSLDIIQDFLVLLDILPLQKDNLISSGVGRVVYFYTKVDESRVTPGIKRQAHALVDKWSRPIVDLSQDYRTMPIKYAADTMAPSQRRRHDASSASNSSGLPEQKTLGVRVPQIDRSAYNLMPESSLTYDKSRSGKSDKYKKLKSHMAKMKQIKRT
ncbi:Transcription factor iws1 [Dissophora globulifera]|nr:Transcription factor iws1 [Dissophora globulifera]